MNKDLLNELTDNLKILIDKNILDGKFIVLFGINTPGDIVIKFLRNKEYVVNAVIDNNKGDLEKFVDTLIYSPEELLSDFNDNAVILICSRYYEEMCIQLENMGYVRNKHIFKLIDMNKSVKKSLDIKDFKYYVDFAYKGLEIYRKIVAKYGDFKVFINPIKANGDVYIMSSYIRKYATKNNIENYIITVVGKSCYKVTKLFDIQNVEILTQDETDNLAILANLLNDKVRVIQPYYSYLNYYNNLNGYKKLTFSDYYKYGFFGLDKNDVPDHTMLNVNNISEIHEYCGDKGIIRDKTAILCPYTNSLPGIGKEKWQAIAVELIKRGWKVYTNCANDNELPIKETESLYFSFENAIEVSEYAGLVISARSGLCEVLSNSRCNKIIIYPKKTCGFGSVKDVYSLVNMGMTNVGQTVEIEDIFDSSELIVKHIMDKVENLEMVMNN